MTIAGDTYSTTTVNSTFLIDIRNPGDKDYVGKTATFTIGNIPASETAIWTNDVVKVNLSNKNIIFEDLFSAPSSGWPVGTYTDNEYGYENGEYSIAITNPLSGSIGIVSGSWIRNLSIGEQDNFTVEVEVRQLSGVPDSSYGLCFMQSQYGDQPVTFLFSSNIGSYRIEKVVGQSQIIVKEWTPSSHIRTGTYSNNIKITRRGSQMFVYANDQLITDIADISFSKGEIAIGVQKYTHVHFDNFRLYN